MIIDLQKNVIDLGDQAERYDYSLELCTDGMGLIYGDYHYYYIR